MAFLHTVHLFCTTGDEADDWNQKNKLKEKGLAVKRSKGTEL